MNQCHASYIPLQNIKLYKKDKVKEDATLVLLFLRTDAISNAWLWSIGLCNLELRTLEFVLLVDPSEALIILRKSIPFRLRENRVILDILQSRESLQDADVKRSRTITHNSRIIQGDRVSEVRIDLVSVDLVELTRSTPVRINMEGKGDVAELLA